MYLDQRIHYHRFPIRQHLQETQLLTYLDHPALGRVHITLYGICAGEFVLFLRIPWQGQNIGEVVDQLVLLGERFDHIGLTVHRIEEEDGELEH